jgi:hypothetical protein
MNLSYTTDGLIVADSVCLFSNADAGLRIFTYDNNYLILGTNKTERIRISAAGGVSIGTATDPGAGNLLVAGTLKSVGAFGCNNATPQTAALCTVAAGAFTTNITANGFGWQDGTEMYNWMSDFADLKSKVNAAITALQADGILRAS